MFSKWTVLAIVILSVFVFLGCPEKSKDPKDDEPGEVPYNSDVNNSFIATITDDDTIVVSSMQTQGGTSFSNGDTLDERVVTISGTVPDYLGAKRTATSPTRLELSAHGGSCLSPGPWNDTDTFSTSFAQTISISYSHNGVMCTGDWGYTITLTNLTTGNVAWRRSVLQGIGAAVDQTEGSLVNLPAATYEIEVSTVTGTHTYATVTYTPGGGGAVGSSIVVYHNGNLYPVSEASPGATYSHVVDLINGSNTIRVLVIGNFDAAAQVNLANIFAVSDPISIFCVTEQMAIRAVLSWQLDDSDVDMHLIAPNGKFMMDSDCYFGNTNPNWGDSSSTLDNPMLDHDNTWGYGPETMVLPQPRDGLYTLVIHYYSDHGSGPAPSKVVLTLNETSQRIYGPKTLIDEQIWIVTGIRVTSGTASFAAPADSASLFSYYGLSRPMPKK